MESLLHAITNIVVLVFLAATLYGIFGKDVLWGSEPFALLILATSAYVGGVIVANLKLPSLIGMLTVGILYRNLSFIPFYEDISTRWASTLRFIVSAVSAAILVPEALSLEEQRLGTDKGVPTLLMAAVSLDNIAALTGFVIVFNILTSNESLTWTLGKRLIEPCIGLVLGTLMGIFLWYFPNKNHSNQLSLTCYRTLLLCLGGLAFTFVGKRTGVPGVGALGCVSLAFSAALRWRNETEHFKILSWITGILWKIIEPFLFGIIGAEITMESLQSNISYGTLVVLLGVSVRVLFTVVALYGSSLCLKEKVFVSASWLSKATVQAAVASQALDYGRSKNKRPEFETLGNQVLTTAVLSILLTAPLGAALMFILGPRFLKRDDSDGGHATLNEMPVSKSSTNYGTC